MLLTEGQTWQGCKCWGPWRAAGRLAGLRGRQGERIWGTFLHSDGHRAQEKVLLTSERLSTCLLKSHCTPPRMAVLARGCSEEEWGPSSSAGGVAAVGNGPVAPPTGKQGHQATQQFHL